MRIVERITDLLAKVRYCSQTLPQTLGLGLILALPAQTTHFQKRLPPG